MASNKDEITEGLFTVDLCKPFDNHIISYVKRRSMKKPEIAKTWGSTDFESDPLRS